VAISVVATSSGLLDGAAGTKNFDLPGTPLENDIIVIAVTKDTILSNPTPLTSGYTYLQDQEASAVPSRASFYKRMGSTPDTSVDLDHNANGGDAGPVVMYLVRGVDTTTAIDNTVAVAANTTGMPDPPSFTTLTNDALRIIIGHLDDDAVTGTHASYTNLVTLNSSAGGDGDQSTTIMASQIDASASAEDPAAFGGGGTDEWGAVHFALRPAATAREIANDAGSYSISGSDVALQRSRLFDTAGGSYAIAGQDVGLLRGRLVATDAGSYAISGQAVTFPRTYIAETNAGTYTIAGQVVLRQRGVVLNADPGSYTVAGQALTFDRTYILEAGAGTYAIAGQTVDLLRGRVLDAAPDAYTIAGQDVTLSIAGGNDLTLDLDPGAYTISGQAVALQRARLFDTDAGSYAISGSDVALLRGRVLDADPSSYAVSGSDVALERSRLLDVDGGTYEIAGQDVDLSITADPIISLDGGAYTISGSDVELERGRLLDVDGGSYEITGSAVILDYVPAGGSSSAWKRYEAYRQDHPQADPVKRKPVKLKDIPPEIIDLVADPDPEPIEQERARPDAPIAVVTVPDINEALYEPIPLPRKKPKGFDPVELDNDFILMAARMRR
jgi:hypothetical protein